MTFDEKKLIILETFFKKVGTTPINRSRSIFELWGRLKQNWTN